MIKAKPRLCKQCGLFFVPSKILQRVCSPVCAYRKVKQDKEKERLETKSRKQAIKTLPTLKYEAQVAFNAYIRARDAGRSCICCGMPLTVGDVGGSYDCGHYRSVGSAPHLRYDERNAHAQRKQCNRWGGGRAVDYRIGLIVRIGLVSLEQLEADQEIRKWSREELQAIRTLYVEKLKQLKKDIL